MNPVRLFCYLSCVIATFALPFHAACAAISDKSQKDSIDEQLLQWNRKTLVIDYQHHGSRNAKWDPSAVLALETFAKVRSGAQPPDKYIPAIVSATKAAVTNGCDDPMLKYLYARFVLPDEKHTSEDHAKIYASVVEALQKGKRSPIRKFYAAMRAAEAFNMQTASTVAALHHWRDEAKRYLLEVANDKD